MVIAAMKITKSTMALLLEKIKSMPNGLIN